jgi:hypothetical protein
MTQLAVQSFCCANLLKFDVQYCSLFSVAFMANFSFLSLSMHFRLGSLVFVNIFLPVPTIGSNVETACTL